MCRGCDVYDVHASQLSCLDSSAGRALCLQCGVLWLRILPDHEAAHFSLEKLLSWVLCLVCLTVLACLLLSSFLLHLSNMYMSLTHRFARDYHKLGSRTSSSPASTPTTGKTFSNQYADQVARRIHRHYQTGDHTDSVIAYIMCICDLCTHAHVVYTKWWFHELKQALL